LVLNFFVSFAGKLTTESVTPNFFQRLVTGAPDAKVVTTRPAGPQVSVLEGSPADPRPGDQWIDTAESQYRVTTEDGVYGMPLTRVGEYKMVQSQFRLKEYISFVGMLALSFGAAFQMPVVVVFLAWAGIFSAAQMGRARKFVILGIVVGAAVLTPTPDAVSMSLLALPMYGLFEGGLLLARALERKPEPSSTT
jgi:hypothetical protein